MLKPRDYQLEAVYSIFRYFDKYKAESGNPVVVLPTGTGKSICLAEFLRLVCEWWPGQKLMLLTHVKELIEQNADKLKTLWPDAPLGIYSAGLKRKDVNHQIIYAGIASVAKRAKEFGNVSLILVDECHLISPKDATMYQKFFSALREVNPNLKIIGFTATPFRMGFGPIIKLEGDIELGVDAMFDEIVFDASTVDYFNWFIREGYLMPLVPKRTKMQLDITGVHKRGGEYVLSELQTAVNKEEANLAAVQESLEWGADRKSWLVFCSGVDHSEDFAALLNEHGIPAAAVHSKLTTAERDKRIADFKAGKLRALTNNNVLTTGFDFPGIDMIIMLRPTGSPILWVQMLGRGTRPVYCPGYDITDREQRLEAIQMSDKHDCLVLDFSGNSRKLGPINDPAVPRRPGTKGGGNPIYKCCDHCSTDGQYPAWRFCGGLEAVDTTGMTFDQKRELVLKGYTIKADGIATAGEEFCGKPFVFQEKLKRAASTEVLVKETIPIIENFAVENVIYQKHVNRRDRTRPPTLKVTYHCGQKTFSEFVCLMHSDFAGRKAYNWWKKRTDFPLPASIDDALDIVSQLRVPTHIRVQTSSKWPEILACCYDGTCFNEQPALQTTIGVQVYTKDSILSNNVDSGDEQEKELSYASSAMSAIAIKMDDSTPLNYTQRVDEDIPF